MPGLKETSPSAPRKRKLDDGPALEIDLSAPEPPSKKALRKAKKKPVEPKNTEASESTTTTTASVPRTEAQESSEAAAKRSNYGVWIGNLPFTVKKDDIRQFLTSQGSLTNEEITRVHLPEGAKYNGRPQNKGFAYVDFTTKKAMDQAIAMSEQLISGRRALIKNANSYEGRPEKSESKDDTAKSAKGPAHTPSQRIFIGNLGFDVTKEIVEEHFKRCGAISHIQVATFEDSGKCKGYAWVEFEEVESAEAAVRGFVKVPEEPESDVDGSDAEGSKEKKSRKPKERKVWVNRIMGRPLRMEFAEDKATRYKKRFGKEGTGRDQSTGRSGGAEHETNDDAPAIEEVPVERSRPSKPGTGREYGKPKKGASSGRYAEETVQRLSGAIVEAKGKKTTFD
ncbi:hypothetical protein FQN50_001557 [Emmonsiellopsis sp. PD_5]|nr:hypothetical protein FQN50_001557 [Emmonsiellopsis sp. PD_5]